DGGVDSFQVHGHRRRIDAQEDILSSDAETFAAELQDVLLSIDPASVTVHLEGVDAPITDVPVGVTKVPHLGEQNAAELSVKPEGHAQFHPYF
ncbi:MAG TPA: hypothetical protein VJ884_04985, partial [Salinibacter sp.]|nr:hypothetical protein [Salinibacter sp.]